MIVATYSVTKLQDMVLVHNTFTKYNNLDVSLLLIHNGAPLSYTLSNTNWTELVWVTATWLSISDGGIVQVTFSKED